VGEACSLTIGAVDLDGSILVEASKAKSRKSRRAFLSDEAMVHLRAWMASIKGPDPRCPLFPSRKGGGQIKSGSQLVEQLMIRCGIRGASSHSLRRSHATGLRDQGSDLLIARAQLGHASIATTEVYLQFYPRQQREEVKRLKLSAEEATASVYAK
jgi:integrase/recombinase XerD